MFRHIRKGIILLVSLVGALGLAGCGNQHQQHPHRNSIQRQSESSKQIHRMSNTKRRGTPIINKSHKAQHEKQSLWKTPPTKKSHKNNRQ